MPYLVDGNNLAHALGLAKGGLADRDACARLVGSFCRSHGARATIVFDGPAPPGSKAVTEGRRVRVVFSGARTADEVLLQFLSAEKGPRDYTVITSDKSLGDRSRHRGALVERAHEFSRRLARSEESRRPTVEKPPRESPDEIAAWLAIFDPDRA